MSPAMNLAIALLVGGLGVALIAFLVLKLIQRLLISGAAPAARAPESADSGEQGVVVVEPGGRVDFINARARSLFDMSPADAASLSRLLRGVRPAEDFLDVCAAPGHVRLNLHGHAVEVSSSRVPGTYPRMLLSIRDIQLTSAGVGADAAIDPSLLRVITDFGAEISASLDIESVVRSVLDSTVRLLPADVLELNVWDQETQKLVSHRLAGANGAAAAVVTTSQSQFGGLSDRTAEQRAPLLLSNAAAIAAQPGSSIPGLSSYMGIPLHVGNEMVGLLEAGQTVSGPFTDQEFELLRLIAPQISTALRNAILFEQEQRRTLEYSGLAGVAQAVGVIRQPEDLFARLIDVITPLFDARLIGFILYDPLRRQLEAQVPFHGLPESIVRIFRARVAPGGAAEALIESRQVLVTANAAADEHWRTLGLGDVAVAASLRDSILMPLVASGQMRGYLQLSHRPGAAELPDSERRLLKIVSDQLAAIIENAVLVRDSMERSARSDALDRLQQATIAASSVDAILEQGLQQIANLFPLDAALAFVLDESLGELGLHKGSMVGVPATWGGPPPSPAIDDNEYTRTALGSRAALIFNRVKLESQIPDYYRLLLGGLALESAMIVPLVARGRPLGEVVLGRRAEDAFAESDLELARTAAASLAAGLDHCALAEMTDPDLRRRVDQLRAVARVSRELGATRSIDELLGVIHQELIQATAADCGSILLLDPDAVVQDPRRLQSVGCPFGAELTTLERRSLDKGQAFMVPDFDRAKELPRPHDHVRSAMFLPVAHQGKTVGLIQLHSGKPEAFGKGDLEVAQTLALQAGTALTNARRIQDEQRQAEWLHRRAATLEKFSTASYALNTEMPLEDALSLVAQGILDSTPFRIVLISVYEPDTGLLRRVAGAGIEPETLTELRARKQQLSSLQQLTQPQFRISHSYYVPADQTPVLPADIHYVYAAQYSETEVKHNAWHPDDFLLLPLDDPQGNPLGVISLDDPSNGLRPDRATIESVELFAGQVSQIILNARRTSDLNNQIESLTAGLGRQQQLLSVTQKDLPVLLRKDLEQTMALHTLNRRAQRVRAGLAITESVSRQLDATSALLAMGRETLTQFGMSIALVAESTPDGPRLLHVLGNIPSTLNVEALFGQRNPLRSSLQTGGPIIVQNLEESEEWRDTPLLTNLRAKAVVSLPVLIDNRPVAAMMAVTSEALPFLTDEDRQVYVQISRQASVVLQNISLLNETRRRLHEVNILLEFSRELTGLDPGQIVEALLQSARHALSASHAGTVLLWNEQSRVLEPKAASGYADDESILRITYQSGEALPGLVFAGGKPQRADEIDFARDYALQPADLGLYRRGTGGRLPVSSLLLPIIVEDKGIGLMVLDNFNTVGAFKPEDEALIVSLSQQAALSLENVRLVHAMRERAGQLQGLNDVATVVASSLRSDQLVAALLDQVQRVLPYDTATLWTREGERLAVSAVRGFADAERRLGLSVAAADSALFQQMISSGEPLFVPDVRQDERFPRVEAPRLSWLGMPMIANGRLTGIIALEKWQAAFYSADQVQLGATLASQAPSPWKTRRCTRAVSNMRRTWTNGLSGWRSSTGSHRPSAVSWMAARFLR